MSLLAIRNLTKHFGGLVAVSDVSLDVFSGEILGLIGPNGAGKSTIFNLITGVHKLTNGSVTFKDREITGMKTHAIAHLGIGRAFQASTLFMRLTVFQNVFNACHMNYHEPVWKSFFHTASVRKEDKAIRRKVMEILEFMGLSEAKDLLAQNLPYGYQKILGVCIALATEPSLLLLDEPLCGMHPEETAAVSNLINNLRDRGITMILVEHNVEAVMRLCDRIAVLNQGKKIAEGTPREVVNNLEVIEAYLGSGEEVC